MKLERAEKCSGKQTFVLLSTPSVPDSVSVSLPLPLPLTMTLALKIKGEKSI